MDSDAGRSRFLTAISHDMRQPLHALLLYLSALDRRVHDEDARAVLLKAGRAAQSLASMFDALIELARIEAGKVEPHRSRVSIQDVFDEIVSRNPGVVAANAPMYIQSDPALLRQIVQQLVSNAIKHGGSARLSAVENAGAVEISVSDSGPGIAAEHQARIFDEFVRLDGASPDGLGLGLTIVSRLTDVLGHGIDVRSSPNEGATFIVRAPRAA